MSETPNETDVSARNAELFRNVEELIKTLDPRPQSALVSITAPERRVLAVRNYLRYSSAKLDKKWAWSDDEIREFMRSEDRKKIEAAIRGVVDAFEALSGNQYSLKSADAKRLIRPLHKQIEFWNGNVTVYYLGNQLIDKLLKAYPAWSRNLNLFKKYLAGMGPGGQVKLEKKTIMGAGKGGKDLNIPRSPTHATPGLSDHGRANAFDFIVIHKLNRQIIADAKTATAKDKWDKSGWTAKLKQAVIKAGNHFEGPLGSPGGGLYEPWHYIYK
jgi:hypothetical protein